MPGNYLPDYETDAWPFIEIGFYILTVGAVVVAAILLSGLIRSRAASSRESAGLCKACGYDLYGLSSCPECGAGKLPKREPKATTARDERFWSGQ